MAASMSDASTLIERGLEERIFVFDRRIGRDSHEICLPRVGLKSINDFHKKIKEEFLIDKCEEYAITTTNREHLKTEEEWGHIEGGDTLYILSSADQELSAQTQERVNYLPHYDTIVKGGMYEYYASAGQNPLPYAFAELIDNSLAATAENMGSRNIEIQLHLDESNPSKNVIFVLDNGRGMTSRQLNNWAVYRLSKFTRNNKKGQLPADEDEEEEPLAQKNRDAPRSLNSDISYFGVGGKQAIFFIGNSCRMVTKSKKSIDVHELTISKEEFEEKEKNKEAIYSGYIRNRKPGDGSHLSNDEDILCNLIKEEHSKENFTLVVITGIATSHVSYIKSNVTQWTRQLAHIYHYYIHGPSGNEEKDFPDPSAPKSVNIQENSFSKLDIELKMFLASSKVPKIINLRNIDDDMQTQYIRSASSTFEFKATVEGTGIVEGVLRYHPFLYDRETYPSDANDMRAEPDPEDDHDYTVSSVQSARGRRAMFECYWNGRLIPYTFIEELDWCGVPKKAKVIPLDCYNRISGVLWTNDKFQVSTNKLTFIDLEVKLKDKHTTYSKVLGKNEKRTDISKDFQAWLKECHEQCDKQVKFSKYIGALVRSDLPKYKQTPWSTYKQIEWATKVYKQGDLVRITKTLPYIYGTVQRFILYGVHEGDVFATGGEMEIIQEPQTLYDEVKIIPLHKLDRTTNPILVKQYVQEEENKLPHELQVTWPEGDEITEGQKFLAGKTIGDIKVEIANRKKELISKLPGTSQKKLLVELKVIWHSPNGDETIIHHISQHGKTWPYWFKRMVGVVKNLGDHTLQLQATVNETGANTFAGCLLPYHKVNFTVTEAEAEKFAFGMLEGPFRVGEPFNVPLQFQDEYGHVTKPSKQHKPIVQTEELKCSYSDIAIKGNSLVIKGITVLGHLPPGTTSAGKSVNMMVKVEGLEHDTQNLKIRVLPGVPFTLQVSPEHNLEVENGKEIKFDVKVFDKCENLCCQPKLVVNCQFSGVPGLPMYHGDCSHSGEAVMVGGPIDLDKLTKNHTIKAKFDIQGNKGIKCLERSIKVLPSKRATAMEVWYDDGGSQTKITGDITAVAGTNITGIIFKIFDEAGKQKEVDESIASKIKVNWVPKVKETDLVKGKLPNVKLPLSVNDGKYCHISLNDGSGVDFSFHCKPVAGEPAKMRCKLVGESSVRMGEIMKADILINITDIHGNDIKKFEKGVLKDLTVSGEDMIDDKLVRALGQTSGFHLSGISFEPCALGSKEICIRWKDMKDYIRVTVLAGPPVNLTILGWDLTEPVIVYNNHTLAKPIVVQLIDEQGNDTSSSNVRIQLAKAQGLKLIPSPEPTRTDNGGKADFGKFQVTGKTGVYDIQPKAFMGRTTISGPKLKISIQPDSTKPSHLQVDFNKPKKYVCGEVFPAFTVSVFSEEGSEMSSASASSLSMRFLREGTAKKPPVTISPDPKRKNDKPGIFSFSKAKIPVESGMYSLWFEYNDDRNIVRHDEENVTVEPGHPVKLETKGMVGTPTVSNTGKQPCRIILNNLNLELKDKLGNVCGEHVHGKILLEMMSGSAGVSEIPSFIGNTRKLHLNLNKGKASFSSLILQENCAGKDGQEYILRFTVESSDIPKNQPIPSLEIPFLFYNDAKKQAQSAALSKERDNLNSAIRTYRSLFDTTQQLIDELKISLKDARDEENKLKNELRRTGIPVSHLINIKYVETEIKTANKEKEDIVQAKRRLCGLQPAPVDVDVLGKIAHLAHVSDHDIARVMSWHMSADMDCVVTLTTKKAKDIYKMTNGKQQVLPLDSIFKKNLPDWNKPLPHERIRQGWSPTGSPVYARNCLNFPKDENNCKIVFGMLLGDTIILDTLDDANTYRQEIVKHTHCPTILTREGDRIRSNGKFGGLMNKALPVEKLRGAVFSEPIPAKYHSCCQQIELLQQYMSSIEKREQSETDLKDQLDIQKTPEMQAKYRECQDAEVQLREIEARLGLSTPSQKRKSMTGRDQGETSIEPTIKRNRTMSPSKAASPATPTRQSGRRAALSDSKLSDRKKSRRN